jgi:hypothetical protein
MTTFRFPPKSMFQVLCEPATLEEFTPWKVNEPARFERGATWSERRGLKRRNWTVTAYDRRGLSFTQEWRGLAVSFACKKGGPGSCNVQMDIEGHAGQVARFRRTDGDRLERMKAWLES